MQQPHRWATKEAEGLTDSSAYCIWPHILARGVPLVSEAGDSQVKSYLTLEIVLKWTLDLEDFTYQYFRQTEQRGFVLVILLIILGTTHHFPNGRQGTQWWPSHAGSLISKSVQSQDEQLEWLAESSSKKDLPFVFSDVLLYFLLPCFVFV